MLTATVAQAAAADTLLHDPCALLDSADYARALPSPVGALASDPYVGRRSSECLWTDAQGQRSLRLVLHPTKDTARPLAQLERLRTADPQAHAIEVQGRPGVRSGDGSQISVAVGALMLSLIGSVPLEPVGAQAVAAKVVAQLEGAESQP